MIAGTVRVQNTIVHVQDEKFRAQNTNDRVQGENVAAWKAIVRAQSEKFRVLDTIVRVQSENVAVWKAIVPLQT